MKKFILVIILIIFSTTIEAQVKYVVSKTGNKVVIRGSSTLHNWEMYGENFVSSYIANYNSEKLQNIHSVSFIVSSKSLKSKEGKTMDNKAYDALKADKYSNIIFKGTNVSSFKVINNHFSGVLEGNLSIAGVTRVEHISFTGVDYSTYMEISVIKKIKMSDYKITPPTAFMGAIKCGNELSLKFDLKYSK